MGKKRKLLAPSSSNAKRPAPTAQIRKATSSSGEGSEPGCCDVIVGHFFVFHNWLCYMLHNNQIIPHRSAAKI